MMQIDLTGKISITYIKTRAIVSPAGARKPNCVGKTVAKMITTAVIAGRLPP